MLGRRLDLLCCVVVLAVSVGGANAAETRTAANGAVLSTPAIKALSCEEMSALLVAYTASNYRGAGEVPEDHPDRDLYDYEHDLATAHYTQCQTGQVEETKKD